MATKQLFNHTNVQSEQNLVESLIIEAIQIYGIDMYYLPQSYSNIDDFYGEDSGTTKFESIYPIEMYIKNVEGFEGEGDFLQQFGLEVRDQITFTVARKRFNDLEITDYTMPREGDLIWFPITKSMYEIQFVEHESIFYQMGELFVYDLQCELFEYSNEIFTTGIEEIDQYGIENASAMMIPLMSGGTGDYIVGETVYQGDTLESAIMTATVQSFDSTALELDIIHYTDTPTDSGDMIGVDSSAVWTVNLPTSEIEQTEMESTEQDNWTIEQEADEFISFEEKNPYGNF